MIGQTLGHYRVIERLGEGGMGVVYKAIDLRLDRAVAIKVLHSDKNTDDVRRQRFALEARTASSLQHPNIITIYDIARHEDTDYIVMEYLPGRTLDSVAARKPLPLRQGLNYAIQIAGALAKAHSAGIVHRDLKPANIMVLDDHQIKVLDFGLAKLTDVTEASDDSITRTRLNLTTDGIAVGTAAYMSPEQVEGMKVDTRSDIFSFGTLLYEMLRGQRAFSGTSQMSTLSAVLTKEPDPIPDLPEELNRFIRRCMKKEPDKRFQSMLDVRLSLEEIRDDLTSGRLPSMSGAMSSVQRGPSHMALAGIALGLVAAAIAGYFYWRSVQAAQVPLHPVQLTSYPGVEDMPTLSPDGSQVAFMWDGPTGENADIYVRLVSGGEPLRLTTDPGIDANPSWSPDGRWIAYRNRADGRSTLTLVSPLGGQPRPLFSYDAPEGADHSWTPDGRYIVASILHDGARRIAKIDVETREMTPLAYAHPGASVMDMTCAVSPSGQTVAFFRLENRRASRLLLVPFEGGKLEDTGAVVMNQRGLSWTPDGKQLVFGGRVGDLTHLWRIPAKAAAPPPARLVGAGEDGINPTFAPATTKRGVRMVYNRIESEMSVARAPLLPNGTLAEEPRRAVSQSARVFEAQVSPNGKWIAFVSDRSGSLQLWVADPSFVDARQVTRLTTVRPGAVRWSPDSETLVFDGRTPEGAEIFLVSAAGGTERPITSAPSQEARPAFSADGRSIYFRSDRSGSRDLWRMPAAGGEWKQITHNANVTEGVESTDGKQIVYSQTPRGLFVMPAGGGEARQLSAQARAGLWSLAGNRIMWFESPVADWSTGLPKTLHGYDLTTRRAWVAGSFSAPVAVDSGQMTLSPDLKSVYFIRHGQHSDLILVDDFH